MNTIRDIQNAAWANKLAKGFNTTNVPLEFCLLTEEVGEAMAAWRRKPANLLASLPTSSSSWSGLPR